MMLAREGFFPVPALIRMATDFPTLHRDDLARARAIVRGDERAFRAFYDEAFPRLYRFALRHTGDKAQAEEITQDALVIALETMPRYRGESSLLSWLFGIARHRLMRTGAAAARHVACDDEAELAAMLASLLPENDDDPGQLLAREQFARRVHEVLDRLPPRYAECLEGKYVLGLSVRELARCQMRSEKSVESTLSRAREAFREAFMLNTAAEREASA